MEGSQNSIKLDEKVSKLDNKSDFKRAPEDIGQTPYLKDFVMRLRLIINLSLTQPHLNEALRRGL